MQSPLPRSSPFLQPATNPLPIQENHYFYIKTNIVSSCYGMQLLYHFLNKRKDFKDIFATSIIMAVEKFEKS